MNGIQGEKLGEERGLRNNANSCSIARSKPRQLVRGWDTENYLNILFIRSRPRGRYISRGSVARRKSKRKRKGRKRTEEETEGRSGRRRVVTRRKGGDRAAGVSAWNL